MSGSRARRWIIGLLLLAAAAAVTAGYLLSKKPAERADKGTLVRAAEDGMQAAGEMLKSAVRTVGDCL